jgi:hypothetical protein
MFKKFIAAATAAFAITAGMFVTAGSASAATSITTCFRWAAGAHYSNEPVFLYQWTGGSNAIVIGKSYRTDASGCFTYGGLNPNAYYYMKAHWYQTYFTGSTVCYEVADGYSNWTAPGNARSIQTGVVSVDMANC